MGIVVGGGPAPGINGVISSATIEAVKQGKQVVGVRGGFKSLFRGDKKSIIKLTIDDVARIHTEGGSILRTSRDYPDKLQESFNTLMQTLRSSRVKYLITIGGDGTAFMANWIEKEAGGEIAVVHVPKTIDNDIPLPGGMPTFGYETARHLGVDLVKNIMEDARTTGRWYFVTTMGRYAGHLALGIGKAAGATLTVIPEEFGNKKISFRQVADVLEGSIIKRLCMDRDHGVAVLAEGISDRFDVEELARHEDIGKDETGRIRLSEIQLGRLMKKFVNESLLSRGIKVTIVSKTIGYELRSADPIPFDIEYTRNLGYGAVRYLLDGGTGAMIVFYEGRLKSIPFSSMAEPSTGKTRIRFVDTDSEGYKVAREYMIRLEKEDLLKDSKLKKIARSANISPSEFRKRFASVAGG
ncbi:6-phosphofructokinase [bacterium BMS3Abin07]|nr:6-phosphofructokinase [bacterium BMS3Abin07]GBE31697.1 6-phosphofructokinase [bacterium BMS3Bbin05]HDL20508.1 6-phosphofructokinase [Nitrospirota bacterium]HDO22050.1 6-phosphofructokinase [Nitrospirota bacterium]HDZ87890.1 6-phosphofructokinase [Nitrospirota bacterium]